MGKGRVIGIDVDIREHNKKAIEHHDLYPLITLIEGSSIDEGIIKKIKENIQKDDNILVILDSCHTKLHVLNELRLYSSFVTKDSYIVVADGIMQEVAGAPRTNEDWSWNNPQEAVKEFLKENEEFVLDQATPIFNESLINSSPTYYPNGLLKRIT
jgi:cephalosporin hydroxylase